MRPITIFQINEHLGGVRPASDPIALSHSGANGEKLISWLVLPPGQTKDTRSQFPLVTIPYAGANYTSRYRGDDLWDIADHAPLSAQLFAAHGYAVLFPSIPLGQAPAEPMSDLVPPLVSAVDAAVATGLIDESRMALSGHSYGGYTVLSVAAQLSRFRAVIAAASAGLNLSSHYGTFSPNWRFQPMRPLPPSAGWSELGQGRMGSAPWVDPERYIRNSPIFATDRINSAVLLIHGSADVASIYESEQIYTALVRQNKDVKFVRYWGEGHGLLNPHNIADMWARVFEFLEDNGVAPGPR